jgi:hypothetical protein
MRLFVNGVSVGTSTTKIIIRPYSKTLIGGYTSPYFSPFGLYGCNGILTQFSFYKATSGTTTFTPVYKTPRYSAVAKFSNYLSNTNVTCSPDGKKIKLNYPNETISANSIAINTGRYYFELTTSNANKIVIGFVNNSYTGNYTSPLLTPATTNRWISTVINGSLLPTGYNPASVTLGTVSDTIGVYLDTATKSWGYIVNGVDYGYKHVGMTGTSFRMVIGTVSGVQSQSIDTMPEVVVNFGDSAFVNSPPYKYAAGFYSSVTQPTLTTPALDSSLKSPGSVITSNGLGISPSGTGQYSVVPTIVKSNFFKNTGKYYFEVTPILNSPLYVGISSHTMLNTDLSRAWSGSGRQSLEVSHVYNAGTAWLKKNGTALTNLATQTTAINGADTSASALIDQPFNTTDSSKPTTIGFAVDYDLGTISVYFKEITPPYLIKGYKVPGFTPNLNYFVYAEIDTSTQNSAIFNFGASSFQLAVPPGYAPGFDLTGYFGYKGYVYDAQGAGVSRKVMALDIATGEKLAEVQSATDGSFVISQLPTNNPNCILLALPNVGETVNAARLFNLAPGVLTVPGVVLDPYYSNVVLLLHGDGTNGTNQFTDHSLFPGTLTTTGNITHTTTAKRMGTSSINVPDKNSKIEVVKSSAVDLTGTYTIEFWARTSTSVVGDANAVISTNDTVYPSRFVVDFYAPNSTTILGRIATSSNAIIYTSPTRPYVLGDWVHFAFVNNSTANTHTVFINGVVAGSRAAVPLFNATTFQVGKNSTAWAEGPYQIDDLRITKGIARYTSNFAVPTAPFPDA